LNNPEIAVLPNNSMQLTALRAAADAERYVNMIEVFSRSNRALSLFILWSHASVEENGYFHAAFEAMG
jgi:hypothetical protein